MPRDKRKPGNKSLTPREAEKQINESAERLLHLLRMGSESPGAKGKIPNASASQWADNVATIRARLKTSGVRTRDIYRAGQDGLLGQLWEDMNAFSKAITALSKPGTRQLKDYKYYLAIVEAVSNLPGENLLDLVRELTVGVKIDETVEGIPEWCFRIHQQLRLVANRVGRKHGLREKFRQLASVREQHLRLGGECVWPDDEYSFEEGYYTPKPNVVVADALQQYRALNIPALLQLTEKQSSATLQELARVAGEDSELTELAVTLRDIFIEQPQRRRLARNTYFSDTDPMDQGIANLSGKTLVLSWIGDALESLPIHYAGFLNVEAPSWSDPGQQAFDLYHSERMVRSVEEFDPVELKLFSAELLPDTEKLMSVGNGAFLAADHLALFLYPSPDENEVIVLAKIGNDEGTNLVPLDIAHLSLWGNATVFAKDRPREFPYQCDSLRKYLMRVIKDGSLERDWGSTATALDQCPLWSIGEELEAAESAFMTMEEETIA